MTKGDGDGAIAGADAGAAAGVVGGWIPGDGVTVVGFLVVASPGACAQSVLNWAKRRRLRQIRPVRVARIEIFLLPRFSIHRLLAKARFISALYLFLY